MLTLSFPESKILCLPVSPRSLKPFSSRSIKHYVNPSSPRVENMMLRMEDVSLKENSIKMSMQTLDVRLAKLEEIAVQNADSLYMLNRYLATLVPPGGPLVHEVGAIVQPCPSAGVMQVKGSLRRRANSVDVARCETWTPYKQRRPLSQIQFGHARMRPMLTRARSAKETPSRAAIPRSPAVAAPKNSATPFLGSDLFVRRRNSLLAKMQVPVDLSPAGECRVTSPDSVWSTPPVTRTTHSGVNGFATNAPSYYTNAHQGNGLRFAPSNATSRAVSTADHMMRKTSVDESRSKPIVALLPMTPIITPLHTEYTSITDEIDTSCVNYGSPCVSPSTPRRTFCLGTDSDIDIHDDSVGRIF